MLRNFLDFHEKSENVKMEIKTHFELHDYVPPLFRIKWYNFINIETLLNETTSFSVVRHPFLRLCTFDFHSS